MIARGLSARGWRVPCSMPALLGKSESRRSVKPPGRRWPMSEYIGRAPSLRPRRLTLPMLFQDVPQRFSRDPHQPYQAPMPLSSLIELVEQVNRGGDVAPERLGVYQRSANSAERFLAHHAGATLGLRQCHAHLRDALESIDFADRKVLEQFVGLSAFVGREDDATGPTVAFGRSAIRRGETVLGVEAAASAAAQDLGRGGEWSRSRENLAELGELIAEAATAEPWNGSGEWANERPHIGYLTSALGDDEPASRTAAALAAHVDSKKFVFATYATEGYARREGQQWAGWPATPVVGGTVQNAHAWINFGRGAVPSQKRGGQTLARLKEAGASTWIAPTDGDVVTAARALADRLVADQTDVLIIDAEAVDPVAALVVAWRVAPRVLWVSRRTAHYASGVDAVCYFDAEAGAADAQWWKERDVPTKTLLEGVDLKATSGDAPARKQYGIPDSAVICCTAAADVDAALTPPMRQSIIDLLRKQPQAVYLVIGGGDTSGLRRTFESAGVGRRVGYAGPRRDLAGFLKMADVYLAPFGGDASTAAELLTAMGAGLPVVATADGGAGDLTGSDGLCDDAAAYVDRAAKLVREGAARRDLGGKMRRRVEQHYSFAATARAMEAMLVDLLGRDDLAVEDEATGADELDAPRGPTKKPALKEAA